MRISVDLCGSEHGDQSEITHVCLGKPEDHARSTGGRRYQVDVCEDCLSRPVADVLAFCQAETGHKDRPHRGVVRISNR